MNGSSNKIEIFTPFGEAFELMKKILFQPVRLEEMVGDRLRGVALESGQW